MHAHKLSNCCYQIHPHTQAHIHTQCTANHVMNTKCKAKRKQQQQQGQQQRRNQSQHVLLLRMCVRVYVRLCLRVCVCVCAARLPSAFVMQLFCQRVTEHSTRERERSTAGNVFAWFVCEQQQRQQQNLFSTILIVVVAVAASAAAWLCILRYYRFFLFFPKKHKAMKENLLLSSAEYDRIIVKMLHDDTLRQLYNISNCKLYK